MRFIFNLLFLPIRILLWLYFRLLSPFRKGDHILIEIPSYFSDFNKTPFMELLTGKDPNPMFFDFIIELKDVLEHPGIKKVSFSLDKLEFGFAELNEIAIMIQKMKEKGIKVSGYANSGDIKSIYLLSFMDEKYSFENGEFFCLFPSVEAFFVRNLLKKWGIEVENFASGKHKSFAETFTRDKFSNESRENLTKLILSLKSQLLNTLKNNTGMDWEKIAKPVTIAKDLMDLGFFSGVMDEEDFQENLEYSDYKAPDEKEEKKKDFRKISMASIRFQKRKKNFSFFPARKQVLSIVPLKGDIVEGEKSEIEIKEGVIAAHPVIKLLREIRNDKSIKAVLLEIDSGGGSAFASDLIYREVEKLRKEKKVYSYLKNIAASGGYYIAMGTEKIYANPFCVTGSIGTVMVRPDFKNFYQKIGITKDRIEFYPGREIFSEYGKLTQESRNLLAKEIQRVKGVFYSVVCKNRNITESELEPKAGGRVFSGLDFYQMKMVDYNSHLLNAILDLQEESQMKSIRLEYFSPTYNMKSAFKNFRSLISFISNPLDLVIQAVSQSRNLEYKSYIAKSLVKKFANQ